MSLCLPVAGSLPASRTHAARRWTFIATADTRPGCGVLTIVQGKRDVESYAVEPTDGQVLFCKLSDGEVYGVDLERDGRPARCNCKGFLFGQRKGIVCKHFQTVLELIADGVLTLALAVPTIPQHSSADLQGGF